jgi:antitoxin VapB
MAKNEKISAKTSNESMAANRKIAKLFRNGRSQAVRLPKEFRFKGNTVRVRKVAGGVLLEPMISDPAEWLAELKKIDAPTLFPHGRRKRKPPIRKYFD